MNPTQSVCKHCPFEIYFSDFYKSWLHKKVVAETLHVAEPVAEPASTGEQQQKESDEAFWKYLDENREAVRRWPGWMRGESVLAARPSEPSAPQIEPNILERVKKAFPEFAAPQTSAELQHETTDCVHDFGGYSMGTYRGHFYPAAPQPVADPAPPPTPSVSTPYKNGDAQKWFEDYCYGHHINFAKRIETGGEDSKRLDELVPEILEAFLDQFFPQGTPQVEEISREIAEKLAAMHLIVWQGLGQAMDEYAKEAAAILRKHGVGAPAPPETYHCPICRAEMYALPATIHCPICEAAPAQGTPEPSKVEEMAELVRRLSWTLLRGAGI